MQRNELQQKKPLVERRMRQMTKKNGSLPLLTHKCIIYIDGFLFFNDWGKKNKQKVAKKATDYLSLREITPKK